MTTAGKSSKRGSHEPGGTPTFDPFTELWPTPNAILGAGHSGWKATDGRTKPNKLGWGVSQASISSAEGHPASPSATLDEGWEREMTVTSGRRCFGWYGNANLGGSCSRTFLASLLTRAAYFSPVCRLIWRMQATKSSRLLYFRLWPSVRRTGETESLWLPTPSAHPGPNKNANAKQWGEAKSLDAMARTGLWPTPRANEVHSATLEQASGRLNKIRLEDHAVHSVQATGRLNPAWVSLLMGAPADWSIPTSNGNAELRGLGNAVVPQVAEHLGRLIMEIDK